MNSLKHHLRVLPILVLALTTFGCSALDTEGTGATSDIDAGSLDASSSDGGGSDAIILDGGCTPGTPIAHEDPCLVCSCGEDGVATCEPATAGTVCATSDCCLQATTCQKCEGDDCPVSGMACTGEAVFSCEDGNPCTEDRATCVDEVCACDNAPVDNGGTCVFDPNACTVGDTCQEGVCVQGEPADTEDGNPCTTGVCVKGVIEQKALEGPCSDGDPCTVGDTCILAQCVPDSLKECPELPCAESGWCDSDVGDCVYDFKADGTSCDAGNACGGEGVCQAGQCELAENPCDDLNPCTADICSADGACQNLPLEDGSLCENQVSCTVSTCKEGLCQPVPGAGCDDGNPCTLDECEDGGACTYTDVEDGTSCGDDDVCNGEELCQAGACEISPAPDCGPGSPCMDVSCHPILGCLNEPKGDGAPCGDDDVCNGEDLCEAGVCQTSAPLVCDSDDECVSSSCDPQSGCVSEVIPGCGDDEACLGYFGVLDGETCIMVPDALSAMPSEFTIEFWIRPDGAPSGPSLFDKIVDSDWSNPGFRIQYNANGPSFAQSIHYQEINQSGGMNGQVTQKDTVPVGSWTHFAVSRTADLKWKMFLDGVAIGNGGGSNHFLNQSNDEPLWIGCTDFTKAFFPGAFDEIRISGEALYTGNFVAPTEPLGVNASTLLLYDFDQTEGGTVLDRSGNGNHGTIMGSPQWELGGPVFLPSCDDGDPCTSDACDTGACVHTPIAGCGEEPECPSHAAVFDGASCIEIPDVLNDGTESYTLEMWFYSDGAESAQRILDKIVDGDTDQPGFRLTYNDFPTLMDNLHYQEVKQSGNLHGVMTGKNSVAQGEWIHYAFVRTSTGSAMRYLNGQALGATQFNATLTDQSNDTPLWIGCEDFSSLFMTGRIDELRISAGERYDSDFEVKDVGFVTDDETIALYHFDEGAGDEVIDASGNGHHGTFHGNPAWAQESPIWTESCDPVNGDGLEPGKYILDAPLETLSGVANQAMTATVSVWGAGGSGGFPGHGGAGAYAKASFELAPGDLLELVVAEGGTTKSGGGGASVLTLNGAALMVVGGGGGAGGDGCNGCSGDDLDLCVGCGGGAGAVAGSGQSGTQNNVYGTGSGPGQGGTQSAGGAGGVSSDQSIYDQPTCSGGDGGPYHGGSSRQATNNGPCNVKPTATVAEGGEAFFNGAGGGGGSGHFGGGGGAAKWTYSGGGGGGGSSWAHADVTIVATEAGAMNVPGGTTDPDYAGDAAAGGLAGDYSNWPDVTIEPQLGQPGRIVLVLQ